MVNLITKSCLLLIEWKMSEHLKISVSHTWTMILLLLKITWKLVSDVWEHMNS